MKPQTHYHRTWAGYRFTSQRAFRRAIRRAFRDVERLRPRVDLTARDERAPTPQGGAKCPEASACVPACGTEARERVPHQTENPVERG